MSFNDWTKWHMALHRITGKLAQKGKDITPGELKLLSIDLTSVANEMKAAVKTKLKGS